MEKELGDKLSCRKDTGEAGGEPVSSPSLPTHRGTCHQRVALKIPWNLAKTPIIFRANRPPAPEGGQDQPEFQRWHPRVQEDEG